MPREVVSADEQAAWDAFQRLDRIEGPLIGLDPDLVEWTFHAADEDGKLLSASIWLDDDRCPMAQLAERLRSIAAAVERLSQSP